MGENDSNGLDTHQVVENTPAETVSAPAPSVESEEKSVPVSESVSVENKETNVSQNPPEDVLTMSKKDYDDKAAIIRQIAERRSEQKWRKEFEKIKSQDTQQANEFYDENLGINIPSNLTMAQYQELALKKSQGQPLVLPQNTQQSQNTSSPSSESILTEEAERQVLESKMKISDFDQVLAPFASLSAQVLNAASMYPDGIKNLYDLAKNKPHELFRLLPLAPSEQQYKVWQLNEDIKRSRARKVVTSANPQPAPLSSSTPVQRLYEEMGYDEKRAYRKGKLANRYKK